MMFISGVVHAGSESLSKSNTTSEKALDGDQLGEFYFVHN
jgi:hypothetical protein